MTDSDLEAFLSEIEQAEEPTFELFEKAFFLANPGPSPFGCSGYHNEAIEQWNRDKNRILQLLEAEAYTEAAFLFQPNGLRMAIQQRRSYEPYWIAFTADGTPDYFSGRSKNFALALLAACLAASLRPRFKVD